MTKSLADGNLSTSELRNVSFDSQGARPPLFGSIGIQSKQKSDTLHQESRLLLGAGAWYRSQIYEVYVFLLFGARKSNLQVGST